MMYPVGTKLEYINSRQDWVEAEIIDIHTDVYLVECKVPPIIHWHWSDAEILSNKKRGYLRIADVEHFDDDLFEV